MMPQMCPPEIEEAPWVARIDWYLESDEWDEWFSLEYVGDALKKIKEQKLTCTMQMYWSLEQLVVDKLEDDGE